VETCEEVQAASVAFPLVGLDALPNSGEMETFVDLAVFETFAYVGKTGEMKPLFLAVCKAV
jgi:hypothetical protein